MGIFEALSHVYWRPHIGDPYPLAWVTVVAYVFAAGACAVCAFRVERIFGAKNRSLHRLVWGGMSVLLLLLGINKQLDFHNAFTQFVRAYAVHYDVYEVAKRSRKYFILGLGLVSLGGLAWLFWCIRRSWRRYVVLLLGAAFIIRFVLVRAAGFYSVRLPPLSRLTGGAHLNWAMELAGVLIIAAGAILNIVFARKNT